LKNDPEHLGLSKQSAASLMAQYGQNILFSSSKRNPFLIAFEILTEPMVLLLVAASVLYFILGQWSEGWMLVVAILVVASISFFQTLKSDNAILELGKLTQAKVKIKRDGILQLLPVAEIVPGDIIFMEEGMSFPADGKVLQSNDLAINESQLTGESIPVNKQDGEMVFAGTQITSGSLYVEVKVTGRSTMLGKLGKSLTDIKKEKTVLQTQIGRFVVKMAWIGVGAFVLILGANFMKSHNFIQSLLEGLTIAMAMIPEEIPVAFASFMALGAVRLASINVLAREPQTVESLGSATVICTDKTGTLTTEGMELIELVAGKESYAFASGLPLSENLRELLLYARLSSEPEPFDSMEKAIDERYTQFFGEDWDLNLVKEYPLSGLPPMMSHVYTTISGNRLVAAKGGIEKIITVAGLQPDQKIEILAMTAELSSKGFRILGVAKGEVPNGDYPEKQEDFQWKFLGCIALFNPPKSNAKEVVSGFYKAGIEVKMITGDFSETASAIAKMVGIKTPDTVLKGDEIMAMAENDLVKQLPVVHVFARMYPEAKLRVVNCLKKMGEIVAMTGDGVNDGPALKSAHIGVAMGNRGTEVARQASSLILVKDDLTGMLDAISFGRKIYLNLKKAISYIVSIHIPIILSLAIPLAFGWKITGIFSPIHIIFLELVMGPTCSIAFENEPAEPGIMSSKPRKIKGSFFSSSELLQNISQGIMISISVLLVYYFAMMQSRSEDEIRTLVFTALVFSNIFLTLVNRSFEFSVFRTLFYPNPILWWMLGITFFILLAALLISPVQKLFHFTAISFFDVLICLAVVIPGVFWIELVKVFRRKSSQPIMHSVSASDKGARPD